MVYLSQAILLLQDEKTSITVLNSNRNNDSNTTTQKTKYLEVNS